MGESGSESVWSWGLAEFRDKAAADAPTPGGGSAAMVSAAIGMGLVVMALRITARKADDPSRYEALVLSGERLMGELSAHADADIGAFEGYMEALRLPKETDADKAARRQALQDASKAATEIPLNAAASCLEALDLARQAAPLANDHIVSDVAAGAILIHGAMSAALLNVDINVKSLKDEGAVADYRKSRRHLQESGDERRRAIDAYTAERLA